MMPYILHIDTSADNAIVALSCNGIILHNKISNEARNHAGSINLLIETLITEAKISFTDLSAIATCGGPGSYTGLRIGLATAKGLCFALDKPLILDNKLTLLSYQSFVNHQVKFEEYITVLTARAKEYFIAVFDTDFNCMLEPRHITEEQLITITDTKKEIFLTIDSEAIPEILKSHKILKVETDVNIDFKQWAKYSFNRFKCHDIEILSTSEPFYLKQVYTHK